MRWRPALRNSRPRCVLYNSTIMRLYDIWPAIFIIGGAFFGLLAIIAIATARDEKNEGDENKEEE